MDRSNDPLGAYVSELFIISIIRLTAPGPLSVPTDKDARLSDKLPTQCKSFNCVDGSPPHISYVFSFCLQNLLTLIFCVSSISSTQTLLNKLGETKHRIFMYIVTEHQHLAKWAGKGKRQGSTFQVCIVTLASLT